MFHGSTFKGPQLKAKRCLFCYERKPVHNEENATCRSMNKRRAMFQTFKSLGSIFQRDTYISHVVGRSLLVRVISRSTKFLYAILVITKIINMRIS